MTIEKKINGENAVLSLKGWMDTQSTLEFERVLISLGPEIRHLILDLADLEYTSSAGVRQIVAAHKRMSGSMVLKNVQPEVMEVLTISGVARKLHFES